MNRREFLAASVAGAALLRQQITLAGPAQGPVQAAIDASTRGEPVSPLIFGGYMEPATTQVWAEMLTDRKFANPITEAPATAQPSGFGRFSGQPFRRVGPEGSVEMDTTAAHDLTPTIRGVDLRGAGRLHQIAPPGADATSRAGQEPAVTIVETALTALPASLHIPPVSVSLYELDVA